MARESEAGMGALSPAYTFALNPYADARFTSCPICHEKTGQRKLPLLVYIEPDAFVALGYTHRYCKRCDLLIGHQHEIEKYLTDVFSERDPTLIGNTYFICGTVERRAWREGMQGASSWADMRPHVRDFKGYEALRMTRGGWYAEGDEPPVREPSAPVDWVKS